MLIPKEQRRKAQKAWKRLLFLGYAIGTKGYRFQGQGTSIIVSRNAKFEELVGWDKIHSNEVVFFPIDRQTSENDSDKNVKPPSVPRRNRSISSEGGDSDDSVFQCKN